MPDQKGVELPENSHIVHPDYLNKGLNSNKNDLIRRLRNLVTILRTDEVEAESPEWPGLAAVAELLMSRKLLNHKDQEVRLFSVLASIEILTLYAPEVPWDEKQVIELFQQMTRHLGNLANTTDQRKSDMFQHYAYILEYTAQYKLGCLLVDMDKDENESARETQIEFFHTLLDCLHHEHPTHLIAQVRDAIVASLEEYDGVAIPIALIDELLKCIGQGPTCTIVDPNAGPKRSKRSGKLPERQVKNPSFIAASGIIQKLMNRLALPISQLLNGLLQREPYYVGKSTIQCIVEDGDSVNEVHQIIYHLHRVAPQVLTTVMGTISNDLSSPDAEQRLMVVKLLGRLFAVKSTADQYAACFREWLRRCQDVELRVRQSMIDSCMAIIKTGNEEPAHLAAEALRGLVRDPSADVRSSCIRCITESAFQSTEEFPFMGELLHAVGDRVSSKHKVERQDAITGLAHVYNKLFLMPELKSIVEKGDDCDLELILTTLRKHCSMNSRHRDEKGTFEWIPAMVFRCLHFTDAMDSDMRSKVVHLVDSVIMKGLTPTATAVAWAMIFDQLDDKDRAFLTQMLKQRALLQKELASYIEKRSVVRGLASGSEEAITADSEAFEQLETVAQLTAPIGVSDVEGVLTKFHSAKDKRIFHILSSITNAQDSKTARIRALEELPPRIRSFGDATSTWVLTLVKRSAMGESLNSEIIENCVILAQECLKEEEVVACRAFLQTVELVVQVFPDICSTGETFTTLGELLSDCGRVSNELRKSLDNNHIVTLLSSILSNTTSTVPDGQNVSYENHELKEQLVNLCTREGTPDQAHNAVHSLAKILNPDGCWSQAASSKFSSLFQTLTSTTKLRLDEGSHKDTTLVTILSSLSALAECSPLSFLSDRGDRAIKFTLETVLLARNTEECSNDEQSLDGVATPSPRKNRKGVSSTRKTSTPEKTGVLEDPTISSSCRRLCAAIQFLVSLVRFSRFANETNKKIAPADRFEVQSDVISSLFHTLTQIIVDQGLPPSNRDRNSCKSRRDRAALRQFSVVSVLRLCDPRVGLEKDHLTLTMWQILSGAFLDEEKSVREAILNEYSDLLSGNGAYGASLSRLSPTVPSLRFLALICFTGDGEHDHDASNGCASNVGALVATVQEAATRSIIGFRRSSEAYYARCKALGKESVHRFETAVKMKLMPENAIPYAYHLLTHRRETPSMVGSKELADDASDEGSIDAPDSNHQSRILHRRLRLLLDPLVHSLGEHADNISYLIRMTETLGKKYGPVDVSLQYSAGSQGGRFSLRSPSAQDDDLNGQSRRERTKLLNERLATICSFARDILVTYIKQDVNITPYPGQISFPVGLFKQSALGVVAVKKSRGGGKHEQPKRKRSKPNSSLTKDRATSDGEEDKLSNAFPQNNGFSRADLSSEVSNMSDMSPPSKEREVTNGETKSPSVAVNGKDVPVQLSSKSSTRHKRSALAKELESPVSQEGKPLRDAIFESGKASRVHFSPEVNQKSKTPKKSASVSPKDSVYSFTSPATLATSASNAADTLGATPPPSSIVPTSTAMDNSDDDEIPGAKSTSQSIASFSTGESHSTRSSRRRKQPERYLPSPEETEQKPKRQKKTPPPVQIHLNQSSRSSLGSTVSKNTKKNKDSGDDLDFPSGAENRPKSKSNRGEKERKRRSTKIV